MMDCFLQEARNIQGDEPVTFFGCRSNNQYWYQRGNHFDAEWCVQAGRNY